MHKQLVILGALHVAMSILYALAAAGIFLVLDYTGAFKGGHASFTGDLFLVLAGMMVLFAIPEMICGIALMNQQSWIRSMALIVGCVNLVNFPFGTILGFYSIYVLMSDYSGKPIKAQKPAKQSELRAQQSSSTSKSNKSGPLILMTQYGAAKPDAQETVADVNQGN